MAPRRQITVKVFRSQVSGLFDDGRGDAAVWNKRVANRITSRAIRDTPTRSGVLRTSFIDPTYIKVGRYECQYIVRNIARHAFWVHQGTEGPIFPIGDHMNVPKIRGAFGETARFPVGPGYPKTYVEGQRGNPWITRATEAILAEEVH